MLEVWERKVREKVFGRKCINGQWEKRTNNELNELYQRPNIVSVVRAQRLRWLGHIGRINTDRIPRLLVLLQRMGGRTKEAKAKSEVKDHLVCLGVRRREKKAQDKKEWRRIVNKAMGLQGSES